MDDATTSASIFCCDVSGNFPFEFSGLSDPTGANGDISQEPLCCDPQNFDWHLAADSPCSPAHVPPGCVLIGAFGVGCAPVPVIRQSWGGLKAQYR